MKQLIGFAIAAFLLTACIGDWGGDSESDNGQTDEPRTGTGWTGKRNAAGYPDIEGQYSFSTAQSMGHCSDGSSGSLGAMALNGWSIRQTDNTFTIVSTGNVDLPGGMTIIDDAPLRGNLRKDGSFVASRAITVTLAGFEGTESVLYSLVGVFAPGGWSGTYEVGISYLSYNRMCQFETTFDGDQVAPSTPASRGIGSLSGRMDSSNETSILWRIAVASCVPL